MCIHIHRRGAFVEYVQYVKGMVAKAGGQQGVEQDLNRKLSNGNCTQLAARVML